MENKIKTLVLLVGVILVASLLGTTALAEPDGKAKKPKSVPPREIRLAVFDLDVIEGTQIDPRALTDQVVAMLSTLPKVKLVDRSHLTKVASEHQISLSGLVNNDAAVRLGKFVSAQYVVVGRASRIGQTNYIVLRVIDVETTVQTTVATKSSAADGPTAVIERLQKPLAANIRMLQAPVRKKDDKKLAALRRLAKPFVGKVVLIQISEEHINRPLNDPAAQMVVAQRLKSLGISTIVPIEPMVGWKEDLLATGKYNEKKADYLLEGEGMSGFAARLHGLTGCRARVELRLIKLPGREVTASDRGVASGADLVEALAAKKALEEAGVQACDAVISRAAREMQEKRNKRQKKSKSKEK